jgi:tetratricopeptide (TPR) repeat protein
VRARGGAPIAVAPIVAGYARDPGVAERLARDAVAEADDGAAAQAAVGMTFSLLGDPARARTAWQAAVDLSPEPAYVRGLAEAIARAGDPDAALVYGTTAAAASGDPAVVWIELARALAEVGAHVHALEAARYAIDLAGADTIADALDVAIASSRALERDAQANELAQRRARVAPLLDTGARDGDPTDVRAAVRDGTPSRLWTAARWNPRDVAVRAALLHVLGATDVRRAIVMRELVQLAGDREPSIGRAAVVALAAAR